MTKVKDILKVVNYRQSEKTAFKWRIIANEATDKESISKIYK